MSKDAYRKLVEQMWADSRIVPEEIGVLAQLQQQLGVSDEDAAEIEREVMGMTKEEALVSGMGTNLPSAPAVPAQPVPAAPSAGGMDTLSGSETLAGGAPEAASGCVEPGSVVGGRYEVLSVLGRGGMGQVLKVQDKRLGRICALKVLAPEHAGRADLLDRMKREVLLCQMLRHPGIVQVFGYDEDADTGLVFFTMEYMEGQTLREWLLGRKGEPVPLAEVERITRGIVDALEYAHGQKVVHLDLKPDNVMLSGDLSVVRILDFGISRALDTQGLSTMLSGAGTPYYMAPEQEQGSGAEVGRPADVYALGAMVYELLTGVPPRGSFEAPHEVREEVPSSWSKAVMVALSPQPAARPAATALLGTHAATPAASTTAESERDAKHRLATEQHEGVAESPLEQLRTYAEASIGKAKAAAKVLSGELRKSKPWRMLTGKDLINKARGDGASDPYTEGSGGPPPIPGSEPRCFRATLALIVSGPSFLFGPFTGVPGFFLARSAIRVTERMEGQPDASRARLAQKMAIFGTIIWSLLLWIGIQNTPSDEASDPLTNSLPVDLLEAVYSPGEYVDVSAIDRYVFRNEDGKGYFFTSFRGSSGGRGIEDLAAVTEWEGANRELEEETIRLCPDPKVVQQRPIDVNPWSGMALGWVTTTHALGTFENSWHYNEYWPVNSEHIQGLVIASENGIWVSSGSGASLPSIRAGGAEGWSRIENTWRSDGVIVEEWRRLDSKSRGSELALPPDIVIRLPNDWGY